MVTVSVPTQGWCEGDSLWGTFPVAFPGASGQAGAEHVVTGHDTHAPREVMPWGSMWV